MISGIEELSSVEERIQEIESQVQTNASNISENKDRLDYIEYEDLDTFDNSQQFFVWERLISFVPRSLFSKNDIVSVEDTGIGCKFGFAVEDEETVNEMIGHCDNLAVEEHSFEKCDGRYVVEVNVHQ